MAPLAVNLTVVIGPETVVAMDEQQFKNYLLKLLREAINEQDSIIIQPNSHQAMVLSDG